MNIPVQCNCYMKVLLQLIIDVSRDTCTSYSYLISPRNLMHIDVEVIVTLSMEASICGDHA